MAITAQQIATNINKRFVYYGDDGNLQIKNKVTDSSVTVNGEVLTHGFSGAAVQFQCAKSNFEGFAPQDCTEINPTKPAWVQLKELTPDTSGPLATVNIKLAVDDEKVSVTATSFNIMYTTSATPASITMSSDYTITLPKPSVFDGKLESLQTDITNYCVGLAVQKLLS